MLDFYDRYIYLGGIIIYLLEDTMRKESKKFIPTTFLGYGFAIIIPLLAVVLERGWYLKTEVILITSFCLILGTISLYCWLYAVKYRLCISKEKLSLSTLFKKTEIGLNNIVSYSYQKYGKSVFYQFKLCTENKIILVNTRFANEFSDILQKKKIQICN